MRAQDWQVGSLEQGTRNTGEVLTVVAARVIQEELLKDFANVSELSDWFGREDKEPPAVVVKKPNPRNIQNAEKIKELEEQIQRYVCQWTLFPTKSC